MALRTLCRTGAGLLAFLQVLSAPPRSLDPALVLERLVTAPDLVTPIGCAVDSRGRIAVLESHTHFPPEDYSGPKSDRILLFPPRASGSARVLVTDGIRWGMQLAVDREDSLYLTHRNGVIRFEVTGDPPKVSGRRDLVVMETRGDYPHNGLGGMTFGPDGWLYLGTGENLGLEYSLQGVDGRRVTLPAGSGGVVVRCRPDGSGLEGVAKGFWNVFGMACDAHGRVFAVDNDPDSRPPCRLIHVIHGGDYGFQFRHGRDGLSPLIAWDGELPGTLGMMSGTGEAPSSVLDAARTRFPSTFGNTLLVASSWDHRLERHRAVPVGASLRSTPEVLVEGDEDFRPVSLAAAPDGSVVFTDWVKSDYPVHRSGALWRLAARTPADSPPSSLPPPSPAEQTRLAWESLDPPQESGRQRLLEAAGETDPFLRAAAIHQLARTAPETLSAWWPEVTGPRRASLLLAIRRALSRSGAQGVPVASWIRNGLRDPHPDVRIVALIWALEDAVGDVGAASPDVLAGIEVPPRLAALHALAVRGSQPAPATPAPDAGDDGEVRTFPTGRPVSAAVVQEAMAVAFNEGLPVFLRREAVQDLAGTLDPQAVTGLQRLAQNRAAAESLRCEAILSLTGGHEDHVSGLRDLLQDPSEEVALELARALRPWTAADGIRSALEAATTAGRPQLAAVAAAVLGRPASRPHSFEDWMRFLEAAPGNPERGSRVFRSADTACIRCHQVLGRGGALGPDLSAIRRGADRGKLLRALLEPSRDIAPQFADHQVETLQGDRYSGRLIAQGPDGSLILAHGQDQMTRIPGSLVKTSAPGRLSLMPEGLLDPLSAAEVRDLMAFLESLR